MKSGYEIFWTGNAEAELKAAIEYLEYKWTGKVLHNLFSDLEKTLDRISENPDIYPPSEIKKEVHKAVVAKYNTLYYKVSGKRIDILSFFSNRQNPDKLKI